MTSFYHLYYSHAQKRSNGNRASYLYHMKISKRYQSCLPTFTLNIVLYIFTTSFAIYSYTHRIDTLLLFIMFLPSCAPYRRLKFFRTFVLCVSMHLASTFVIAYVHTLIKLKLILSHQFLGKLCAGRRKWRQGRGPNIWQI